MPGLWETSSRSIHSAACCGVAPPCASRPAESHDHVPRPAAAEIRPSRPTSHRRPAPPCPRNRPARRVLTSLPRPAANARRSAPASTAASGDISTTSQAKASAGFASHLSKCPSAIPTGLSFDGSRRPSSITSNPAARSWSATFRTCALLRTSTPQVIGRSPTPSSPNRASKPVQSLVPFSLHHFHPRFAALFRDGQRIGGKMFLPFPRGLGLAEKLAQRRRVAADLVHQREHLRAGAPGLRHLLDVQARRRSGKSPRRTSRPRRRAKRRSPVFGRPR